MMRTESPEMSVFPCGGPLVTDAMRCGRVGISPRKNHHNIILMAMQKLSKVVMRSQSPHISTHALTGPVPPPIALRPWVDPEE